MTFPGLFAGYAKGYQKRHNFSDEERRKMLAKVAAKNHRNALANPKAQLPLDITYEEILNKSDDENPMIVSLASTSDYLDMDKRSKSEFVAGKMVEDYQELL